jgi:hypothetical protein
MKISSRYRCRPAEVLMSDLLAAALDYAARG